jgi:DNA polymerase III subunit beta
MKVICDRAALLDAASLGSSVAPQRTPKPQLSCVMLDARKTGDGGAGLLMLSATDADVSLRLSSPQVEVQEEGRCLVPAAKLQQIVSAQDDATLTLEAASDQTTVRGAGARFTLHGFPSSDFPPLPEFPKPEASRDAFSINAGELHELISRTIFSTARENSRYAINGVLLKRDGKKLEMVATDGRRLALARGAATVGDDATEGGQCIVPTKALTLVNKLLTTAGDTVRVAITDNQIMFAFDDADADTPGGGTILASNLVEGSFPPYEDVIPRDQDKKAVFDVARLGSAVRRASLLTNEESRGVRMAFTGAEGGSLKLSSRAPEMGESEIEVGVESFEGDDIEVGFNPAFIVDALKVVPEETILFELKAPNKPGLLRSGNDFLYVVMPVNLQ